MFLFSVTYWYFHEQKDVKREDCPYDFRPISQQMYPYSKIGAKDILFLREKYRRLKYAECKIISSSVPLTTFLC